MSNVIKLIQTFIILCVITVLYIASSTYSIHYQYIHVMNEYMDIYENIDSKLSKSNFDISTLHGIDLAIDNMEKESKNIRLFFNMYENANKEYQEYRNSSFISKVKTSMFGFKYIDRLNKSLAEYKNLANKLLLE